MNSWTEKRYNRQWFAVFETRLDHFMPEAIEARIQDHLKQFRRASDQDPRGDRINTNERDYSPEGTCQG